MIRKQIVYINSDRSVFPKELKIANQFEIKTNEIKFIFDGDIPRTGYPYLILTNRSGSFYLPLVDDSVVFGNQETWIMGGWSAHIMISQAEIINGIVNKSEKLFISDDFGLWVEPSDINIDDLKEQQLPTPLKLLYDELLVLKKELEDIVDQGPSGEGNDGATFIPNVSPEGVISWTNDKKLPNPDPVNIKGPPGYTPVKGVDYFDGKDGMSAYELALQEGFVGTLDDWLNSLKGDPGPAYTLTASDKAAITASVKTEIDPELEELKESIEDLPDSYSKTESDNKYQPKGSYETSGTSESKVSEHNVSDKSHNDIRLLIQGLIDRLNAFLDTDDTTLDQISELVAYINSNKSLIDSITTSKVNVSDIVDNLTTNVSNKPLSAKQGVALKSLIDTLQNSLNSHTGDTTKHITAEERKAWNAKSDFSGSYSDLKNIPTEFNPSSHNHDDKYQPKGSYEVSGTADTKVNEHNKSISAHADIRKEVSDLKESIADLEMYELTATDKQEIAEMVDGATIVQAPTFVDSIDEMKDTNKVYVLNSTGTIWAYKDGGTTIETVTEQIVGTTDNPWSAGRLSSGNPNGEAGYVTTPYIDLSKYNVPFELHLEGIAWVYTSDGNRRWSSYDANKTHIKTEMNSSSSFVANWKNAVFTANGETAVISFTQPITTNTGAEVSFARFSGQGTEANANVYVTYEAEVGGKAWVDTGVVYGASNETIAIFTEFNLSNPSVKGFVESADYSDSDYSYTNVTNYSSSSHYRKDLPMPVIIDWVRDSSVVGYIVNVNSQMFYTKESEFVLYNLIPNTTYHYTVYGLCADSTTKMIKSGSFKTTSDRTRMLNIDGMQNVRDIGGYVGYGSKRVKYGLIYRGSAFDEKVSDICNITDEGKKEMLLRIGIRTDLDLRGANNISKSALGNDVDFFTNPYSYLNYASAITDSTHRGYFKNMLEYIVAQLTANEPVYIHCSGGCDRTGTLVFLLLGLLGVSESNLAKEYELSSFSKIGSGRTRNSTTYDYKGMVSALKTYSGSTITDKFYTFATSGCGISAETITSFRNLMLS